VFDLNFMGTFLVTRVFSKGMVEEGRGSIVNISSAAIRGVLRGAHYSASKGGMVSLTRSLALEWAPEILVNCVAAGIVDTPQPRIGMTLQFALPYVHHSFEGEAALSVGKAVDYAKRGVAGIINVMPFSCMPGTIAGALLKRMREDHDNIPLLSISYEGPVYDPIVKESGLQFVRGDQTTGLIGPEGVYLSSSTYWYPTKPDSIAKFQVEALIPEPFRIVTQGELVSENLKEGCGVKLLFGIRLKVEKNQKTNVLY
jgi:hypothetical protein